MATRSAQIVRPYVAFSMLQPVMTVPSAVSSAARARTRRRCVLAFQGRRRANQIDIARLVAHPARPKAAIASHPPVTFLADRVLAPAVEAGSAVGLRRRTPVVGQQPERVVAPHAIDDVRDARDLEQPRGQRLHFEIRVARLGGCGARPMSHGIEPHRRGLVADDIRATVLLAGEHRRELSGNRKEIGLVPFVDVHQGHRETSFMRGGQ
jgi:hypothetical protein